MAQRQPILHRVLDFKDEAFALLALLFEQHSLNTRDASFAESLYALKRGPIPKPETSLMASRNQSEQSASSDILSGEPARTHCGGQGILELDNFRANLELHI